MSRRAKEWHLLLLEFWFFSKSPVLCTFQSNSSLADLCLRIPLWAASSRNLRVDTSSSLQKAVSLVGLLIGLTCGFPELSGNKSSVHSDEAVRCLPFPHTSQRAFFQMRKSPSSLDALCRPVSLPDFSFPSSPKGGCVSPITGDPEGHVREYQPDS